MTVNNYKRIISIKNSSIRKQNNELNKLKKLNSNNRRAPEKDSYFTAGSTNKIELAQLKNKIGSFEAEIKKLESELNIKNNQLDKLIEENKELTASLERAREYLISGNDDNGDNDMKNKVKPESVDINSLVSRINELSEKNNTLCSDNKKLMSERGSLDKTIKDLKTENNNQKIRISELEKAKQELSGNIAGIEDRLEFYQKEYERLQSNYNELKSNYDDLLEKTKKPSDVGYNNSYDDNSSFDNMNDSNETVYVSDYDQSEADKEIDSILSSFDQSLNADFDENSNGSSNEALYEKEQQEENIEDLYENSSKYMIYYKDIQEFQKLRNITYLIINTDMIGNIAFTVTDNYFLAHLVVFSNGETILNPYKYEGIAEKGINTSELEELSILFDMNAGLNISRSYILKGIEPAHYDLSSSTAGAKGRIILEER